MVTKTRVSKTQVMQTVCEDGTLEVWRVDRTPTSKKRDRCTICGAKITEAVHFEYQFIYAEEHVTSLVLRACCLAHQEQLEEALVLIEEELAECPNSIDSDSVWDCIEETFREHGITLHIPRSA